MEGETSEHGPTVVLGQAPQELDEGRISPGTEVGRYRVVGELGAGGMGVVYSAEDPELGRTVALKVLKARPKGRDKDEPDRLRREARALAQLAHPNVVRVYDVGVFEGRVFLALELVEGPTLAEWLATPRPWEEVVPLFVDAGHGLAAAHQAGLVHRDFKPSNVLLSDDGRVRVMDFGLAAPAASHASSELETPGVPAEVSSQPSRDIETAAADVTGAGFDDSRTRDGVVVGTPAYLSPEHLLGRVVDGRSDQFSFCVALYFALYGVAPFPSTSRERYLAIEAQELGAPKAGRNAPRWLHAAVVRGLALSPDARWPDMEALLEALQPGKRRAWPWVVGIVGVAGIAAAIAWPEAGSKCDEGRVREAWESRRGEVADAFVATGRGNATEMSDRVAALLDEYVDAWTAARAAGCAAEASRDNDVRMACLDAAATRLTTMVGALTSADAKMVDRGVSIVERLPKLEDCDDPDSASRLPEDESTRQAVLAVQETISAATAFADVGDLDQAHARLAEAVPRAREIGFAPLLANSLYQSAINRRQKARYDEARALLEEAVALATAEGLDRMEALTAAELGIIHGHDFQDFEASARWFKQAEAAAQRDAARPTTAAFVDHNSAVIDIRRGRLERARAGLERAHATYAKEQGADSSQCARALINLANIDTTEAKYQSSIDRQEEAKAIFAERLGKDHPTVALILANIALGHEGMGEYEKALEVGEQALAMRRRVLGDDHPDTGTSLSNLCLVLMRLGRHDEARERGEEALEVWTESLGENHTLVAAALTNLALVLAAQDDVDTAIAHHRRALRIRESTLPEGHPEIATSLANIGNNLRRLKRYDEARDHIERARAIWLKAFGPDHPEVAAAYGDVAELARAQGNFEAADASFEEAYQTWLRIDGSDHPAARSIHFRRAFAWFEHAKTLSDGEKARNLAEAAREILATDERVADELKEVEAWLAAHR